MWGSSVALDFPSAPGVGEVWEEEGATFIWNGTAWIMQAPSFRWATIAEAVQGVLQNAVMSPKTLKAMIDAIPTPPPPPPPGAAFCRKWCLINGTTGAIQAHRGIASVGLTGSGSYDVRFIEPFPDLNYFVLGSARSNPPTTGVFANPMHNFAFSLNMNNAPGLASCIVTTGRTGGAGQVGQVGRGEQVHISFWN